jgi:peptidoglycan/LPS O-acetylase OafA/YrhL
MASESGSSEASQAPVSSGRSLVHPEYRADIDGLRAVSVLLVVAYHAFPTAVKGGFVGVDVFFVISGYLISSIIFNSLDRGGFSFAEFYSRRIRRIFPALAVVLCATYAVGWTVSMPDEYKQLGKHIAGGAGFVSNFVLWRESGYFDGAGRTKPLLHLWSLGIEEQFYLVWPAAAYLCWKRKFSLWSLILVVIAASFFLNLASVMKNDAVAAFYSPATRLWELILGGALAHVTPERRNWLIGRGAAPANAKALAGLLLIMGSGLWLSAAVAFPGGWGLLPTAGALLLISAGPDAWINRNVLSNRAMVWVGLISYPLYLWHWPLLSFLQIIEASTPSPLIRLGAVLISAGLASLTYVFVEKPIRTGGSGKVKVAALCCAVLAIGCIGYGTYREDGFASRFPEMLRGIASYNYDYKTEYREGTCFLRQDQDQEAFRDCVDRSGPGSAPLILLWGDSHAAHLYPGMKAVMGDKSRLAQFTASACPPIVDIKKAPHLDCEQINAYVVSMIAKTKPDRVLLAAEWSFTDSKAISKTIAVLKGLGIRQVSVVGPVPRWDEAPSKTVYRAFRKDSVFHGLPARVNSGLNKRTELDENLRLIVEGGGAEYISARNILCNDSGCLTRVGESLDSLVVWDTSHFTRAGSQFVVSRFP